MTTVKAYTFDLENNLDKSLGDALREGRMTPSEVVNKLREMGYDYGDACAKVARFTTEMTGAAMPFQDTPPPVPNVEQRNRAYAAANEALGQSMESISKEHPNMPVADVMRRAIGELPAEQQQAYHFGPILGGDNG